MPELPEVETIKRELEKALPGKRVTEVCVHNPAVVKEPSVAKFKSGLCGAGIKKILRRAKVLIFELSNGKALVIHLRMTGQLVYPGTGTCSAPLPTKCGYTYITIPGLGKRGNSAFSS